MSTENINSWMYTNEYGEQWIFEYDPSSGVGILKGSDVDWESFKVVDGKAIGLILNDGELIWLKETWKKATSK